MKNESLNKRAFFSFLGLFLLINSLLYFQNYVGIVRHLGLTDGPTINAGSWTGRMHMLFGRHTYHFIKISGEFLLFTNLFFFIKPSNKWLKRLLYFCFIFYFVYNIYYEFNQKFYGITPAFQNDYVLLSEVLPIFLNSLSGNATLLYILTIIFVIAVGALFVFLIKKLLANFELIRSHLATRILMGFFLFFTLIYSTVSSYKPSHQKLIDIHWLSPKIVQSTSLPNAHKFENIETNLYTDFLDFQLKTKPNIYLLFIESYGTVITESPDLKPKYLEQINNIEVRLKNADYHFASNYSISPVKGGRSWLAFSSFMSGLKVENQIHYNDLIQRNVDFPNMVRYFNTQGYQSYRLSTISNKNSDKLIPYERTNLYWKFNEWWTYWDFKYKGHHYDVLGGIPDQYALGYYRDVITKNIDKPKFLFFITMASHMPWYEPPPFLDDYKELNQERPGKNLSLEGDDVFRYAKAIEYDLELMTRFILEEKEPSIFILVGDHQPPGMEHKVDGITDNSATPIHIISRDSSLIDRFNKDGFQIGLEVDLERLEYLKHEEFYEMLMTNMQK